MKIPADPPLSSAEIVALIDLEASAIEGWVPSAHFDEHSLVEAYRDAQRGDTELLDMITSNRFLALLVAAGAEAVENYQRYQAFKTATEAILGAGADTALASFLHMRTRELAPQVVDLRDPLDQLGLYQLDAFLTGWLARGRHDA